MTQPVAYKIASGNTGPSNSFIGASYSPIFIGMTGPFEPNYSADYQNMRWRNGVEFTGPYWVIYSDDYNQGVQGTESLGLPVAWTTVGQTDSDLKDLIDKLPARSHQAPFSNLTDAITWLTEENKYFLSNKDYPAINFGSGKKLVAAYDPTFLGSYPFIGTKIWDLSCNSTYANLVGSALIVSLDSIALNAPSDYVQTERTDLLTNIIYSNNSAFTVSIWFNMRAQSEDMVLFDIPQGSSDASPVGTFLRVYYKASEGNLWIEGTPDGLSDSGGSQRFTDGYTFNVSEWYHLCVRVFLDDGKYQAQPYINGSELSPAVSIYTGAPSTFSISGTENKTTFLGVKQTSGNASGDHFFGNLGSFYVYGGSLSSTDINQLWERTNFYP